MSTKVEQFNARTNFVLITRLNAIWQGANQLSRGQLQQAIRTGRERYGARPNPVLSLLIVSALTWIARIYMFYQ